MAHDHDNEEDGVSRARLLRQAGLPASKLRRPDLAQAWR
jgi:hypothetical protein